MEPTSGLMVTNSLCLVEMLGAGGMGSVWIADHLGLETTVAVKFITTELARNNPALVTRFKREAGVAAKIKSPHVVQIFDHGLTEDGTPYIAMELLEGESLEERLESMGAMNLREAGLVLAQTAQVLSKAHGMGIVHRDIKPANLFLIESAYDLFIKVLDFGIAKHVDAMKQVSVTSTGSMIGSPLYMSPEQFTSAKGVDARADLWSLAVVAYHALTGRPSFGGETLGQVMMAVMSSDYTPPKALRPELPGPFDDWFAKAFARDINQRFQTADELASTFRAISAAAGDQGTLSDVSLTAAPVPPAQASSPAMQASHVAPIAGGVAATSGLPAPYAAGQAGGTAGTLEPTAATFDPGASADPMQTFDPAVAGPPTTKTPWGVIGALGGLVAAAAVAGVTYVSMGSDPEGATTESAEEAPVTVDTDDTDDTDDTAAADAPSAETAASSATAAASAEGSAEPADSSVAAKPPQPVGTPAGGGTRPKPTATKWTPKPTPTATPGGDEKYGF
ncbi:MAG: serine/threonine protein kinase [Deltaproteobacteria bacterium]|nr:serine/threonine protein kinase [Deltaproteobacteria bacterium]